jgi:hypothetical protein
MLASLKKPLHPITPTEPTALTLPSTGWGSSWCWPAPLSHMLDMRTPAYCVSTTVNPSQICVKPETQDICEAHLAEHWLGQ